MKKLLTKIVTACLLATFTLSTTIHAEEKKEEKKVSATNGMPMRGKLKAVDTQNKTITIEGKEKDRVFQVTSQTRIMKDDKPATLDDAKVGEEVGGFALKSADDKYELRSLRIGPKPQGERGPRPEKTEKKKSE